MDDERPSWDEYFMEMAYLAGIKSETGDVEYSEKEIDI